VSLLATIMSNNNGGRGRGHQGQNRNQETSPPTTGGIRRYTMGGGRGRGGIGRPPIGDKGGRAPRGAGLFSPNSAPRKPKYGTPQSNKKRAPAIEYPQAPTGPEKRPPLYDAISQEHLHTQAIINGQPTLQNPIDNHTANTNGTEDTAPNPTSSQYTLPAEEYAYKASYNDDADEASKAIANKDTTLDKATETLEPHEHFLKKIRDMKNHMNGFTKAFEGTKKALAKADGNPNFIYKSVNIKPAYNKPSEAARYPAINTIFDTLTSEFDTLTVDYRKAATKILTTGQRAKLFMIRLERVNILFTTHLTNILGPLHSFSYRTYNNITPTEASKSDRDLAVVGIRRLLDKLDLDMLEYLDINREPLIKDYETAHQPAKYTTLIEQDKATADYVTDTILGYLKAATCCIHNELSAEQLRAQAKAKIIAKIESTDATLATTATDKAITATDVPKDMTTLKQVITNCIQHSATRPTKAASKKRPAKPNNPKANKKVRISAPKEKAGPKKTPAKATTPPGTNSNRNSYTKKGTGKSNHRNQPKKQQKGRQKHPPPTK
jgi:hypothetical protein